MKIVVFYDGNETKQISGNPYLTSLDGKTRATLNTILHDSWTSEERAKYGIYCVEIDPPKGMQWTGEFDGVTPIYEPIPLTALRDAKAAQIYADFAAACDQIREGYPPDEILSWPQQQAQAEAYTKDPNAPLPLLETMAATRGMEVAELASRILANAEAFSASYGAALGNRQRRHDELSAIDLDDPGAAEAIRVI